MSLLSQSSRPLSTQEAQLQSVQRSLAESVEASSKILVSLDGQNEQLDRIIEGAADIDQNLEQSDKLLEGMKPYGWITDLFRGGRRKTESGFRYSNCEWMFADAGASVWGGASLAHLNPGRWTGKIAPHKAIRGLESALASRRGDRPILVKVPANILHAKRCETIQEAIAYIRLSTFDAVQELAESPPLQRQKTRNVISSMPSSNTRLDAALSPTHSPSRQRARSAAPQIAPSAKLVADDILDDIDNLLDDLKHNVKTMNVTLDTQNKRIDDINTTMPRLQSKLTKQTKDMKGIIKG